MKSDLFFVEEVDLSELRGGQIQEFPMNGCATENGYCGPGGGCGYQNGHCDGIPYPIEQS